MPLLGLENFSVNINFPVKRFIVNSINLELEAGEIAALVGESGSGKTTLGLGILGLLDTKNHFQISGNVVFDGLKINSSDKSSLTKLRGKGIGYIFQEPLLALNPVFTIGEQLRETIRYHFKLKEPKKHALNWLEKFELNPPKQYYSYYPHQLSGGMRQRVMIALALAANPELIIADEPTSGVDAALTLEIMSLLIKHCQQNKCMLLITHDIGLAAKYSQRLFVMYQGKIIESGHTKKILKAPDHSYTRLLIDKYIHLMNYQN